MHVSCRSAVPGREASLNSYKYLLLCPFFTLHQIFYLRTFSILIPSSIFTSVTHFSTLQKLLLISYSIQSSLIFQLSIFLHLFQAFSFVTMKNTSKSVPQKDALSSSRPTTEVEETVPYTVVDEPAEEPPLKMFIPGGCSITNNFKVEKPSSGQGRREEASRYICSITEEVLPAVRKDYN